MAQPKVRFKGFSGEWEEKKLGETCRKETSTLVQGLLTEDTGIYPVYGANGVVCHTDFFYQEEEYIGIIKDGSGVGRSEVYPSYSSLLGTMQYIIPNADVAVYFLLQILNSIDYTQFVSGSGIPHIYFKDYSQLKVFVPKLSEQRKIASYFRRLDSLISSTSAKISSLKQMKQASLQNMFPQNGKKTPKVRFKGFSGEWEEKKLGEMGKTYNGLSGKTKEDFGHGEGRFVTYMNVFSNSISDQFMIDRIEVDVTQNTVHYGDILFTVSSETPEEVGMSSVWLYSMENVYLNSFCFGYRHDETLDNEFAAYLLRSPFVRQKFIFLAQGISRFNISKGKVMNINVLFPSNEEQRKIASYFRSLDSQITLQEQRLEKLKQMKAACLDQMFV